MNGILRELKLPLQEFREIIVLSGTDYNLHQKVSLYKALKLHKEYKQAIDTQSTQSFYGWLSEKHIPDLQQLYDIYRMFDIGDDTQSSIIAIDQKRKPNFTNLRKFLEPYGFVFL